MLGSLMLIGTSYSMKMVTVGFFHASVLVIVCSLPSAFFLLVVHSQVLYNDNLITCGSYTL